MVEVNFCVVTGFDAGAGGDDDEEWGYEEARCGPIEAQGLQSLNLSLMLVFVL